tara:strand:- start:16794 stop:16958 length:165 start_codon:yes stop_codon:yes gene_type:complete
MDKKLKLNESQMKKFHGGLAPFLLIMVVDAVLLGTMSGYMYETYITEYKSGGDE